MSGMSSEQKSHTAWKLCPQWSSSYDTHPDNKRLGFSPLLRHRNFSDHVTYSTQCYIWWLMWSLSLKCMRTWFLLGRVTVIAISVLGCLLVMTLAQIERDWGLIPHWGTESFRSMSHMSHIRPAVIVYSVDPEVPTKCIYQCVRSFSWIRILYKKPKI